jgi:hypothetical protein
VPAIAKSEEGCIGGGGGFEEGGIEGCDGMCLVGQGYSNTEGGTSTATNGPEEVGVVELVGCDEVPGGCNDGDFKNVIST